MALLPRAALAFGTRGAYTDPPDGVHTFQAKATTNGGHDTDPSPATHTWTIDATPPNEFALGSPAADATTDPKPTLTVRVRDRAGNFSSWRKAKR